MLYVQKFGGTSVGGGKAIVNVCNTISKFHASNHDLVVVVSAISPSGKSKGTTTRFLKAINTAKVSFCFDCSVKFS